MDFRPRVSEFEEGFREKDLLFFKFYTLRTAVLRRDLYYKAQQIVKFIFVPYDIKINLSHAQKSKKNSILRRIRISLMIIIIGFQSI